MSGIPRQIGRYSIERLLGQGAMGSVYLARDQELDRAVAIKTVRNLDLEEKRLETFLERFKNEARAAARLSHPAIVAVYDVGEDEEVGPYLVFEYVAGSTLKQILRGRGPLAPDAVVKLGRQIAAALDTAHAAGVIHRDVKPDNILVSAVGDAKLADFGVARVPDAQLTKEGQFLGTPCYAAPETLSFGRYGPHSDRFSFAAVLYEAITGSRAFPGDDAISVAHHVVHDEPTPPTALKSEVHVTKEVERVVMRGLTKDEDKRFNSAMEMVDALAGAYVSTGVLDRDPTGAQILPVPERTPKVGAGWGFTVAIVLLLVAGVGAVMAFVDFGVGGDGPLTVPFVDAGVVFDAAPPVTDAGSRDGSFDASDAEAGVIDATIDAGPLSEILAIEAGCRPVTFDCEESSKDETDLVRSAIEARDLEGAQLHLARARAFDNSNSDLGALETQVHALSP